MSSVSCLSFRNFRIWRLSEVLSCVSRPTEALMWINEINPRSLLPIWRRRMLSTGTSCRQTSRFWFEISEWSQEDHQRRLQKKSGHSRRSYKKRTLSHGKASRMDHTWISQGQQHRRISLGRRWDFKVELKIDNVQSFNKRWDETIIAMKKQPDEEILDTCITVSFNCQNSWYCCCPCTPWILQNSESPVYTRLEEMEGHFVLCDVGPTERLGDQEKDGKMTSTNSSNLLRTRQKTLLKAAAESTKHGSTQQKTAEDGHYSKKSTQ